MVSGDRSSLTILPPYARRTKSLEVLIPILYLKGISTGDFEDALAALLGKDAGWAVGLEHCAPERGPGARRARPLARLRPVRQTVCLRLGRWHLHVQARLEDDAQCLLVIIGATAEGKKELVCLPYGIRESAQSWKELLLDLKRRGLDDRTATCRRLWCARILEGNRRGVAEDESATLLGAQNRECLEQAAEEPAQAKAKRALQDIWMAETRKAAETALDAFIETYGTKYEKAVECLTKDRDVLFAFYNFPAEHRKHLR